MKQVFFLLLMTTATLSWASTIVPMNKAFSALVDLIPFLTDKDKFMEKKNETYILERMNSMDAAFKTAKHENLLKQDIFAPSLVLVRNNIENSRDAFQKGKKDYALWRMQEITTQCMDCHTRLPPNHSSSFQEGSKYIDQNKFKDAYNLGLAQLIVRQYPEAKATFTKVIDESIVKKQFQDITLPLKQLLLIQTKVMKAPEQMLTILKYYEGKKGLLLEQKQLISQWQERLKVLSAIPQSKRSISNDEEAQEFMLKTMKPLFKNDSLYIGKYDPDLLYASGVLSNFLFENPDSTAAPEAMYWIGMSEKYLKRDSFFGSGELFLKQCVRRHPKSPVAKKCLNEYKESIEFEFTGSRGTDIPSEVESELNMLKALVGDKKTSP